MTPTVNYSARLLRQTGRMFLWASSGAAIAVVVGMWAGLWFGTYQAIRHDDAARFWTAFSFCTVAAAVSGAITGTLAFLGDGTNPFASEKKCDWQLESFAEASRSQTPSAALPVSLAARMRSKPRTYSRIVQKM